MIEQVRLACGVLTFVSGVIGIVFKVPPPVSMPLCFGLYILADWFSRRYPPTPPTAPS